MSIKLLDAFSVRLICYLLIMQPTVVICQEQFSKKYVVPEAWPNYCPAPEDAMLTYNARSRLRCAAECSRHQLCTCFSYYATSRLCCFYGFDPLQIFYNSDCTFMMDQDPLSGDPENGFPVQQQIVEAFGEGPILLPTMNNWILFMNRLDGSRDFNRTWNEYKNGFGDIGRGEFWLGNEIAHRLTNTSGVNYTLRIELQERATGGWFYAEYATFSLDSESNKYALHLSGFGGNANGSLTYTALANLNGRSFSTAEADNDRQASNCAKYYAGGWWFDKCGMACLTCSYRDNFVWHIGYENWNTKDLLRRARMMMKRI